MKSAENIHPSFLQKANNKLKLKQAPASSSCSCTSSQSFPPDSPDAPQPPDDDSSDSRCIVNTDPYAPPSAPRVGSDGKPLPSSQQSSSSSQGEGTKACADPKSTNATGKIGPNSLAITAPPYKLVTCDQVLIIEGTTFASPRDFSIRKTQVFSLSVYMINQFTMKDAKTLNNHILIEDVTELPDQVFGAPTCLSFVDSKINNKIVMCLPARAYVNQIKDVFTDILKCRIGDNLKGSGVTNKDIRRVFEAACKGKPLAMAHAGPEAKVSTFLKNFLPKIEDTDSIKKQFKINPGYSLQPPGSFRQKLKNMRFEKFQKELNSDLGIERGQRVDGIAPVIY